ncbi:peroxide stress protein YaaA [Glaciecola sp. XM2]|uniref:peroxide stress protein YaaA n=1 Tax=Glaciecola sp. XM2 TaxID=1914931 RepID=UPI001BDF3FC3|nr:peroxide stress protein YaaA [Glaciecola sp. XM2]MBT1450438.1 peroxide stress protein YaaA [Glaciecola sp. XM2]
MLLVVSPAKNLDYKSSFPEVKSTQPRFESHIKTLLETCRTLSPADLSSLMGISDKLAVLNAERFNSFSMPFDSSNARPAMFAFNGDVYTGLDALTLDEKAISFAQSHLRILSGLYGVLRPLDLMQPYRLEMGIKLATPGAKSLYEFWDHDITNMLNDDIAAQGDNVLVNLASNEYFSAVKKKALDAMVITPVFKDEKNGKYKIISFYAKKARGMMARYVIENQLNDAAQLKGFDTAGYRFDEASSSETEYVFLRPEQ